jgi:hypothetical protein
MSSLGGRRVDVIVKLQAFERNGGPGYSGSYNGKAFGESPNNELGALPEELQVS